ncbi:MAG: sugar phosphate isomerase/epimerase family protein, partial [Oscillospiraceae bacterium]
MKIAISGETPAKKYNLSEIAAFISRYGASGIEIWPENIPPLPGATCVHRLYRDRDADAAKKILEERDISCACVAFGAAFDKELAADEELFSNELVRAVQVASKLGAKFVNHYLYHVSMAETADTERLKKIYSPAIALAEEKGITLVLEDEAHDSTKNPLEMKRIVEAMTSQNFKTNFDAVNYYQANFEGFPYAYNVLREHIKYVHIKDGCEFVPEHGHTSDALGEGMSNAKAGKHIFYPMIGTGAMNIKGELEALNNSGYDGWCTLEPHT